MTKCIEEIVNDIKNNPETWKRVGQWGLKKDNIVIKQTGNLLFGLLYTCFFSIVNVEINEKEIYETLTISDKYNLEKIYKWWMQNASLNLMSK